MKSNYRVSVKRIVGHAFLALILSFSVFDTCFSADVIPANPNISPQARSVLKYLYEKQGTVSISGLWSGGNRDHIGFSHPDNEARKVHDLTDPDRQGPQTGTWVGVYAVHYTRTVGKVMNWEYNKVNPALIEHWNRGGIPAIYVAPHNPEDMSKNIRGDVDMKQLLKANGYSIDTSRSMKELYRVYDIVIEGLLDLQDKGIPVILRFYQEMTTGGTQGEGPKNFWWANENPYGPKKKAQREADFKVLWREMFDYFKFRGVNNALFFFCPAYWSGDDEDLVTAFYPGDQYVDIVGMSLYSSKKLERFGNANADKTYARLLAFNKPFALGEVGVLCEGCSDPVEVPAGPLVKFRNRLPIEYPESVFWVFWGSPYSMSESNVQDNSDLGPGFGTVAQLLDHWHTLNRDDLPSFRRFRIESDLAPKETALAAVKRTGQAHGNNAIYDNKDNAVLNRHNTFQGQKWEILPSGNGFFKLLNRGSANQARLQHQVLTAWRWSAGDPGHYDSGDNVLIYEDLNWSGQKWEFEPNGDGTYRIVAKPKNRTGKRSVIAPKRATAGDPGAVDSGDNINLETDSSNSLASKWKFVPNN